MKTAIKICICVAVAIAVVTVWSCCKMAGDCDRREGKKDGDGI